MKKHSYKKKIAIILLWGAGALCGIIIGAFFALTHDLPQIRSLESFRPPAVTRILSSDGLVLAEFYVERRDPVDFENIPIYLRQALIVTEDRRFFEHCGVDIKGIFRAVIKNIISRRYAQGASTITQQLAKTLFLSPSKTVERKLREAILSIQIERRYTKNEILELYLNQVYFGSGAYGVESAAQFFFGKPAKSLNLAECALIAGTVKSPSRYSPLINPELAIWRRNIVLKQMFDTGIISESQYQESIKIPFYPPEMRHSVKAPYAVEYIRAFLEDTIGTPMMYKGGLSVHTTISWHMQNIAENALKQGLNELKERMRKTRIKDPAPQGALIAIDIRTGGILAMVGGEDFEKSPFNRAVNAIRQPGSAFKPFIYALALENGWSQNTLILDAPVVYKGKGKGKDWQPENFSGTYRGEITLREALSHSQNIPAIRLIERLSPYAVIRFAQTMGITSALSPDLSLALGTSGVRLLELTASYAVFPNEGKYIEPFIVNSIVDSENQTIWKINPRQWIAMSKKSADVMTDMLKSVVQEGTGTAARVIKQPIGGKTGTTNQYRDAFFIGFSQSLSCGVWVGQDSFNTLGKGETGAKAALPIWIDFMKHLETPKKEEITQ